MILISGSIRKFFKKHKKFKSALYNPLITKDSFHSKNNKTFPTSFHTINQNSLSNFFYKYVEASDGFRQLYIQDIFHLSPPILSRQKRNKRCPKPHQPTKTFQASQIKLKEANGQIKSKFFYGPSTHICMGSDQGHLNVHSRLNSSNNYRYFDRSFD